MRNQRATWIDPVTQRPDSTDITAWRIEGQWIVLDCPADDFAPDASDRRRPGTMLIPATVAVRIDKGE